MTDVGDNIADVIPIHRDSGWSAPRLAPIAEEGRELIKALRDHPFLAIVVYDDRIRVYDKEVGMPEDDLSKITALLEAHMTERDSDGDT